MPGGRRNRALQVRMLSVAAFKHAGGVSMTTLGAMTIITVFDVPVFTASQVQVFSKFLIELTGFGPESFIFVSILHCGHLLSNRYFPY